MSTYGYIATWKDKRVEITLDENQGGTWRAQCIAAEMMKVPRRQRLEIHVMLAEKDGKPVIHTPVD